MKKTMIRGCVWGLLIGSALLTGITRSSTAAENPDSLHQTFAASGLGEQTIQALAEQVDRAIAAGIPADDVRAVVSRGLAAGVVPEAIAGNLRIATTLREKNLPVKQVLDRMEQGFAKGIPPDTISAAVQRLSEKLAVARPLVDAFIKNGMRSDSDRHKDSAIETAARALEGSLSENEIVTTGSRVAEHKGSIVLFDKAVRTIVSLIERGLARESATRLVGSAVARGMAEKDLSRMEKVVAAEMKKGRRADDVIKTLDREIEHGRISESGLDDHGGNRGSGSGSHDSGSDRSGHGGKGR